jgi:hypothetical protein
VAGRHGFARAGGHAIAPHGILQRSSEDVDLFADWQQRADFPAAVDAVIAAYEADGLGVEVELRRETFARLYVLDQQHPTERHRVELVANWRAHPPVQMEIGPVLHIDDVMAGKMDALYNRAAARDFLDIDAAISSGRYSMEALCRLAEAADEGFDRALFARMLSQIDRLDDDDFADYGLDTAKVTELRSRVRGWRSNFF